MDAEWQDHLDDDAAQRSGEALSDPGYVSVRGNNVTAGPDVFDIGGVAAKGPAFGATIGGNIWEDPVAVDSTPPSGYNTGYSLSDIGPALGCADGTPNNAAITTIMSGGGGASTASLLGSNAVGATFTLGEQTSKRL